MKIKKISLLCLLTPSRTYFHGFKEVRVIEIPMYISVKFDSPVKSVFEKPVIATVRKQLH